MKINIEIIYIPLNFCTRSSPCQYGSNYRRIASYYIFLHIKQNQSISVPCKMTNRQIKTILPNLTSKTNSQDTKQINLNIPFESLNHNPAPSNKRNKWIVKESHVQKHISLKKHKHPLQLQPTTTPKVHLTQLQQQPKNLFFTGITQTETKKYPSKEMIINHSIQKSKHFVDKIRSHRKKFLKIRMITEPKQSFPNSPQNVKSKQLYSYLQRNFINDKSHEISNTIIERFKTQSPESLFEKIQEKSRKFLLQKMHKDYKNYKQIDSYKKQSIKTLIEQQIERKKKEFKQDYSKRYNSPYFSFLSLSNEQKCNILMRRQLSSLNSI